MPKRQLAPQIEEISPAEHKSRKRRIKRLVQLRLAYGKSTFFDTHTHQARYPLDEISPALYKVLCKANKLNKHLDLSTEEKDLWSQIFKVIAFVFGMCLLAFYTDLDADGIPDFFEFLNHLTTMATPACIAPKTADSSLLPGWLKTTAKIRQEKL